MNKDIETYNWFFKIIKINNPFNIKEGKIITNVSASEICKFFENNGYDIISLLRVCQAEDENTYSFNDFIKEKIKTY